jgi:hypothetical protein
MEDFMIAVTNTTRTGSSEKKYANHICLRVSKFEAELVMGERGYTM